MLSSRVQSPHNDMLDGRVSWDISIMDLPTDADSLSDISTTSGGMGGSARNERPAA